MVASHKKKSTVNAVVFSPFFISFLRSFSMRSRGHDGWGYRHYRASKMNTHIEYWTFMLNIEHSNCIY